MDVLKTAPSSSLPSGYEIVIDGGRTRTGKDALAWAYEGEKRGAGELVVNSIDAVGTKAGYEIFLTSMISNSVRIPVIASGGAGTPEHLSEVFSEGKADAALVASMLHYGEYTISEIKSHLNANGHQVRV